MRAFHWLMALAALWALGGGTAQAALYEFSFNQSNFTVSPGGTVDVPVFLRETVSPGEVSLLHDFGLVGAGVKVTFDVPPVPAHPARVLSAADIIPNPAFDLIGDRSVTPGSSAQLLEGTFLAPAVKAQGSGPVYDILLGTFRFTAGSEAGEVTHLRAGDFDITGNFNVVNTLPPTVLDPLIREGTATITVVLAVVPEPAALILTALGGAGLLGYAWRRRGQCP
jgi:hypothetical protein